VSIRERDLFEKPILFVIEDEKTWPCQRAYTVSGLPFYTIPSEKNTHEERNIREVLFLPISNEDFETNDKDYFFGFMYLFMYESLTTMSMIQDPNVSITHLQIQYEVSRIRYFPSGEKTIIKDRTYDPLFPTQVINFQLPIIQMGHQLVSTVNDVINFHCNYYVDKKI